ncbi:MAG: flagellar biosynthesis protein FlhF [Clostridiales bacterium]|jgi:flagellar biosynthesis protein FlhF|nr:flagellar biosynthesis protein FlhF [Clostridiales bacterium]MDK2932302.1 flagellar biosynthesis protein FlhF [Clostridiales bacterium]
MKIRRYIGKDTQEAMLKVRMDLGSDAIILNTRKIRQKGFFKIFSKPLIEILAAIDEGTAQSSSSRIHHSKHDKSFIGAENIETVEQNVYKNEDEKKRNQTINDLESKVKNMERLLEKIYSQLQPVSNSSIRTESYIDRNSKIIQVFSNNLLSNNVDVSIVNEIISEVKNSISPDSNINEIAAKLYNRVTSLLGEPAPIQLHHSAKTKVIAFVGPTGVGKTTTLAKIAAIFSIDYQKKVGIISSDTYRIAAVEQLKTYTDILGLPINVIYSPEEITEAISKFSDKDLILIDTAGRSHKDAQQFDELKKIIELSNADEVYLLISVITDYNVCKEIINSYSFLNDYKIIFTKMDESETYGMILNLIKHSNKKLSYITTGQSVPDDIEIAKIDQIAKKLLGSIRI